MHRIDNDLPIEDCAGWIRNINAMNAMADRPCVSKHAEIVLIRVMRGELTGDEAAEEVLSFYRLSKQDTEGRVISEEDLYDKASGVPVNCLGAGEALLGPAEADLFAVRAVEASLSSYACINRHFLERLHHDLFQDVYFFAGALRPYMDSRNADSVLPADIPEALDAWCKKLNDTAFCRDILGKQFAGAWAGFDRIHPFCEGNGRTVCVLLDQIARFYGYCLEMPCHGDTGEELRLARKFALSGDTELLRLKIEQGLKKIRQGVR